MNHAMNVEKWVELFETVGLDKSARQKWHAEFEHRFPNEHQAFLEWLQVPLEDIQAIRKQPTTL